MSTNIRALIQGFSKFDPEVHSNRLYQAFLEIEKAINEIEILTNVTLPDPIADRQVIYWLNNKFNGSPFLTFNPSLKQLIVDDTLLLGNDVELSRLASGILQLLGVADTALRIKSGNAQAINLQEWQDAAGNILLAVDKDANLLFKNPTKGLPYGSCYGDEMAWTQASAVQNTWYPISDTDIVDGHGGLNLVTHDGSGKLTVTNAGRYLINYGITVEVDGAVQHIKSGLILNGTPIADGRQHVHFITPNAEFSWASTAIVSIAAGGYIEVGVMNPDATTPTILVDHLNVSIVNIGG